MAGSALRQGVREDSFSSGDGDVRGQLSATGASRAVRFAPLNLGGTTKAGAFVPTGDESAFFACPGESLICRDSDDPYSKQSSFFYKGALL